MEATPHRASASRCPHLAMITAAFLTASLLLGFSVHPGTQVRAQEFASGDNVVVFADMLNVRSASGLSAEIKSVVPSGTTFSITSGPGAEDGYDWYFISYTSGTGTGWVAGEFLALSGANTGFTIGDSVSVASINLNFRSDPGLDAVILDVVPEGAEFTVVSGATNLDGYDWYEVSNSAVYGTGWVAGEFLEVGGGGGDSSFADGESVQTTDVLNVRSAAGFDGTIFRTASVGEVFTVSDDVIVMDGYTWYLVTSSTEDMPLDGDEGWVAGEFLTLSA